MSYTKKKLRQMTLNQIEEEWNLRSTTTPCSPTIQAIAENVDPMASPISSSQEFLHPDVLGEPRRILKKHCTNSKDTSKTVSFKDLPRDQSDSHNVAMEKPTQTQTSSTERLVYIKIFILCPYFYNNFRRKYI